MRARPRSVVLLAAVAVALLIAACGSSTSTVVTITEPAHSATTSTVADTQSETVTTVPSTTTSPPPMQTTLTSQGSGTGTRPIVFAGAVDTALTEPSALFLSVDGTLYVSVSRWSSWGANTAEGSGEAEYHGCTPSCGQARAQYTPVSIQLSGVTECPGGKLYYDKVQLTEPDGTLLNGSYLAGQQWAPCEES